MSHHIIQLEFKSPVRVGDAGIGLEGVTPMIHSDTLFSALCHTFALIKGSDWVTELLEEYEEQLPFVVSTCFPYRGSSYFVPRPYLRVEKWQKSEENVYKEMKQLKWISINSLDDWLNDQPLDLERLAEENRSAQSAEVFSVAPGVRLDRLDQSSDLYFRGYRTFEQSAGLYFLIQCNDQKYIPVLQSAFELLGDNGLGSERSNGYGQFAAKWLEADPFHALLSKQGEMSYLLGLYHPQDSKMEANKHSYALEERRGWFYSSSAGQHMKRKSVWMFAEGSVFVGQTKGVLVDVSPKDWKATIHHKIIRCGVPLTIKF